jgi:hypothetical protein
MDFPYSRLSIIKYMGKIPKLSILNARGQTPRGYSLTWTPQKMAASATQAMCKGLTF